MLHSIIILYIVVYESCMLHSMVQVLW